MKVAMIGLGIMGSRMAANLLPNTNLAVYNRSTAALNDPALKAAQKHTSVAEAVKDADVVISMLSTPEAVQTVFLDEQGALTHMKVNALWMDCSTVNPSFSRQCAAQAQAAGMRFLDAPVAGSKPQAAAAELVFFVGGPAEDLAPVQPLLDQMGKKTMHLGEHGMGASFKMLVNMMLAESMLVFSETLLLGEKMGIDRNFLLNTLPNLVVAAPFTKFKAEAIRKDDYAVQFPLEWMQKDLRLALETAREVGQSLWLAQPSYDRFAAAAAAGLAREDFSAVHRHLKNDTTTSV